MTMVASLMATNGMVFISDGRVNDLNHNIINDEQVKLFQLSPLVVILPAGGASDQIVYLMPMFKDVYATNGVTNVNDIATHFCRFWQNKVNLEGEDSPVFIISGYNKLSTDTYEPKIYYMQHIEGTWELLETHGEHSFFTMGNKREAAHDVLASEYEAHDKASLASRNKSALRALKAAEQASPEYIGGQTSLWNLKPSFNIRKFPQSEINRLKLRL